MADQTAIVAVINAGIRGALPIALGSLSGIVSERSGIVNIGIEGMMLTGAFAGFMTNVYMSAPGVLPALQSQPIRLALAALAAMVIGGLMAMLHAMLSIRFKVDQIISGTVLNIFALGITNYLYVAGANTLGGLPPMVTNPFSEDSGLLYAVGNIIFNKDALTYFSLLLVPLTGFVLFRTTWGLRTRAIGENPRAADTLGINVHRLQYGNLFLSGMLAGLAGATLTLTGIPFERSMSNGRGFIALAVMIFGMWRPSRAFWGAMLFGLATALQGQLQLFPKLVIYGSQLNLVAIRDQFRIIAHDQFVISRFQFDINSIPHQFVGMLPYILTLVVLAGFVGRARPPAHVGEAYEVE